MTLDPQRDTPEALRSYVPAFNPNFLGLYADADVTKQLTSDFKVFYEKIPGKTPTTYTIDHPVYVYAFDTRAGSVCSWHPLSRSSRNWRTFARWWSKPEEGLFRHSTLVATNSALLPLENNHRQR